MKINFRNRFCTERFEDLPIGATFRTSRTDTFFVKESQSLAYCLQPLKATPIVMSIFEKEDPVIPVDVTIYISDQEADE